MADEFAFTDVINSLCAINGGAVSSTLTVSGSTTGIASGGYAYATPAIGYWPSYPWWPTYWPTVYEDRTAKAFRVVKALMDKKAVKCNSVKQFVDLVDAVSAAL